MKFSIKKRLKNHFLCGCKSQFIDSSPSKSLPTDQGSIFRIRTLLEEVKQFKCFLKMFKQKKKQFGKKDHKTILAA